MTVIAWDGKTLAADRLMVNGYARGSTTKIERYGNELLGITGDLSIGREVADWYKAGAEPKDYPPTNRDPDKGSSLIVICADGEVWKYESSPSPFKCDDKQIAFGSGTEAAMVAMLCGRDAREAVLLAIAVNNTCGNGVDALTL